MFIHSSLDFPVPYKNTYGTPTMYKVCKHRPIKYGDHNYFKIKSKLRCENL